MLVISEFSLRPETGALYSESEAELLHCGKATGVHWPVKEIECQYQWQEFFLVGTSLDNPRKEKLHFYLLDRQFRVLDSLSYSGWFTSTFAVKSHNAESNVVSLALSNGLCLSVKIVQKRRLFGSRYVLQMDVIAP